MSCDLSFHSRDDRYDQDVSCSPGSRVRSKWRSSVLVVACWGSQIDSCDLLMWLPLLLATVEASYHKRELHTVHSACRFTFSSCGSSGCGLAEVRLFDSAGDFLTVGMATSTAEDTEYGATKSIDSTLTTYWRTSSSSPVLTLTLSTAATVGAYDFFSNHQSERSQAGPSPTLWMPLPLPFPPIPALLRNANCAPC